jgi:hypothetical protein
MEFADAVRVLHNVRSTIDTSFVIERCPSSDVFDWMERSRGYFSPRIELGWLKEDEFSSLVNAYGDEKPDDFVIEQVWSEFLGQPHLTHLAIDQLVHGSAQFGSTRHDIATIKKYAQDPQGPFWEFRAKIHKNLDASALAKLHSLLEQPPSCLDWSDRSNRLLRAHQLLDSDCQPLRSEFYLTMFKQILSTDGEQK